MAAPITEQEVERIIDAPKQITTRMSWTISANDVWAKLSVPIDSDLSGVRLVLAGTANLVIPQRFSFNLLVNDIRVRGLCVNSAHGNKHHDDTRMSESTHFHEWRERCRDRIARPIEGISHEPRTALGQFCELCNIDLVAPLADLPPYQADLDLGDVKE